MTHDKKSKTVAMWKKVARWPRSSCEVQHNSLESYDDHYMLTRRKREWSDEQDMLEENVILSGKKTDVTR